MSPSGLPAPDEPSESGRPHELRGEAPSRYSIERELGHGGMAIVYLAFDQKYQRRVALKVLRRELASLNGAERFLVEIGLTARLNHPHILPLLDSGEENGLPFFVMPFVDGESLRAKMHREGPLPISEALRIACHVADALAYAHAQEVLHRDIKPENIMLAGGHAFVTDFGIAKAMKVAVGDEPLTQLGIVMGTPAYMSPEQAVGDSALDARSDVCSLGVVLYEMLTGVTPWTGGTAQAIIGRRFTEPVPSLHKRRIDLPDVLDRVLAKALAWKPEDRFISAAEFADALGSIDRLHASSGTRAINLIVDVPVTPSIAVLPFVNLSADRDNEYLSDGITEEILSILARRRGIRVCSRSSSFALRGQNLDARTIGSRLGVRSVLTGSVRRAGNRLRVSAQLANAADGFQLWTDRYERTLEDVFAIQDDIAASIVRALDATLLSGSTVPRSVSTGNVEAYQAFLRGRFFWNRRTEESAWRAIESFERAIALDGSYALAYAGLADAWATLTVYGAVSPTVAMEKARSAADRAIELDSACAEAQTTLGLILAAHDWRWEEGEEAFKKAQAVNPNYATSHQWYASVILTPLGRFDDALQATARALRLDPLSLALKSTLSSVLFYARRYGEAVEAARETIELDPTFAVAHFFLGQSLVMQGDVDAGVSAAARAAELAGRSVETLAALGHALAAIGDSTGARKILDELTRCAASRWVSPTQLALLHVALGEPESAIDRLESAVALRAADLIWLAVRPQWDPVRADPRFAGLLGQLGLPALGPPPSRSVQDE